MNPVDFYVLLSLSREAAPPSGVADDVLALTGGEFGEDIGQIEGSLRRLLADHMIRSEEIPRGKPGAVRGPARYAITSAGREALVAEAGVLARSLAAARARLPEEL